MKKNELRKLPEMKPTRSMIRAMKEDKGYMAKRYQEPPIWAPKYIWFYSAKKTKDVMELDVFTREMLKEGEEYPRYRIFLHDGKYDTLDNITDKWRTSTIEKLEYANYGNRPPYYWYCDHGIWMSEKEKEILQKFVKNGIGDPMEAVQAWENYKKHRIELDKIDAEMRLVPEIPKDFGEWIKTDGLPQYIFYDAGRNVKEGYCTACKHTVQIQKPRYNSETTCPQMNLCDIAQEETAQEEWMKQLVIELCKEKKIFQDMLDYERKDIGNDRQGIEEDILAMVNPSKFKMIRLRTANILMQEKKIRIMPYKRNGNLPDPEEYTYIDLAMAFEELCYPNYPDISEPAQKIYERIYGEPLYEKNEDPKPETKEELKQEEKPKPKEKQAQTPGKPRDSEEREVEDNDSRSVHPLEEQVPGQTELTRDFPEYCPGEVMNPPEEPEAKEHEITEDVIEEGNVVKDILESGSLDMIMRLLKKEFVIPAGGWKKWQQKVVRLEEEEG